MLVFLDNCNLSLQVPPARHILKEQRLIIIKNQLIYGIVNALNSTVMKNILLCSSNPILVKSLYGMLRDDGHDVETVERPALAVQKVIFGSYDLIIIDSEPFGLSTEDAVQIIKSVEPDLPIVYVGGGMNDSPYLAVDAPFDLEEFKRTIHSITV